MSSHSFAPVPANYVYYRPGLWACRHCGLFSDNQGADVIGLYPECGDFDRVMKKTVGVNHYAPGQPDYPFGPGWIRAPWTGGGGGGVQDSGHNHGITITNGSISGGVCGNGTSDPALTPSGLPIRIPESKSAPTKHVAGIDSEEIDWSAHKEFMKGL